jgi:hypothetical protein
VIKAGLLEGGTTALAAPERASRASPAFSLTDSVADDTAAPIDDCSVDLVGSVVDVSVAEVSVTGSVTGASVAVCAKLSSGFFSASSLANRRWNVSPIEGCCRSLNDVGVNVEIDRGFAMKDVEVEDRLLTAVRRRRNLEAHC